MTLKNKPLTDWILLFIVIVFYYLLIKNTTDTSTSTFLVVTILGAIYFFIFLEDLIFNNQVPELYPEVTKLTIQNKFNN